MRLVSRVIALQPALSPVAATASSCESWMSSQMLSVQRRGGLPRGRRQEAELMMTGCRCPGCLVEDDICEVVGGLYGLRADDRLLEYGQPRAEGLQHSL